MSYVQKNPEVRQAEEMRTGLNRFPYCRTPRTFNTLMWTLYFRENLEGHVSRTCMTGDPCQPAPSKDLCSTGQTWGNAGMTLCSFWGEDARDTPCYQVSAQLPFLQAKLSAALSWDLTGNLVE